jgi:hypothetical protein
MGLRFKTGANGDVDTTAEQLITTSAAPNLGILIKASNTNTGIIYVGGSDVTAGTNDATDGFELGAGESLMVEGRDADEIYVVASANNQRVSYLVI